MTKLEILSYCNKLMGILNDNFIFEIEPYLNKDNHIAFKAIKVKSKVAKRYIIANNTILEIKTNARCYTYQINGQAGKNTKEVMALDIGAEINKIKFEFEKYINS